MDIESRAKKQIRKYRWIQSGDRIGVAMSGGKDSSALLYFINSVFGERRDLTIVGLSIDEGIKGYRDFNKIKKYAHSFGIDWIKGSFTDEFNMGLDEILKSTGESLSCSYCGVLRRYCLNKLARENKVTKLAMGFNLDDEAQSVLMNVFRGDIGRLQLLSTPRKGFVQRIKPFRCIPEREVALYAILHVSQIDLGRCPYAHNALRSDVRILLNDYTYRHPATKFALVNFGEELAKHSIASMSQTKVCERCGEPCRNICRSCQILDKVRSSGEKIRL